MKLAFHYTLGLGGENWRELIELARHTGFQAIDVDLRQASTLEPTEMLDALGELQPSTGRLPVAPGGVLNRKALRFCREIGLRTLTCSVRPSLPTPKSVLPDYQEWARMLADEGLRLAIEALTPLHLRRAEPFPFVQSFEQYCEFVEQVGPNAGFLLDTWHWHHGGFPSPEGLPVWHVHLADAWVGDPELVRDEERLFPGEGQIDLAGLLAALGAYGGFVAPEVFGQRGRFDSGEARARYGLASSNTALSVTLLT